MSFGRLPEFYERGLFVEPTSGSRLDLVIKEAIVLAKNRRKQVHFLFNDTHVSVTAQSKVSSTIAKFESDRSRNRKAMQFQAKSGLLFDPFLG